MSRETKSMISAWPYPFGFAFGENIDKSEFKCVIVVISPSTSTCVAVLQQTNPEMLQKCNSKTDNLHQHLLLICNLISILRKFQQQIPFSGVVVNMRMGLFMVSPSAGFSEN